MTYAGAYALYRLPCRLDAREQLSKVHPHGAKEVPLHIPAGAPTGHSGLRTKPTHALFLATSAHCEAELPPFFLNNANACTEPDTGSLSCGIQLLRSCRTIIRTCW